MTFFREADIDRQIAKAGGVDVTLGSVTVKGLLNIIDVSLLQDAGGDLQGQSVTVTVRTGALIGLAAGSTVVADGVTYRVQRFSAIDDGALTVLQVARS